MSLKLYGIVGSFWPDAEKRPTSRETDMSEFNVFERGNIPDTHCWAFNTHGEKYEHICNFHLQIEAGQISGSHKNTESSEN